MRGLAIVHSVPQRSIQQAEAGSQPSGPPSLDDVDTVMANLEGLCLEEQSWSRVDSNLEQCIQVRALFCDVV